jgi:microcystin-dependent protein
MSEQFVGEIRMFGFNFAPAQWAFCNGQLLAISQNTALFALLGTQFGGNGTSNFALPDLRSRVPIHMGQGAGLSPYTQGQNGGVETVTIDVAQMPSHTHVATAVVTNNLTVAENVSTAIGIVDSPSGAVMAKDPTGGEVPMYNAAPTSGKTMAAGSHTVGGTLTVAVTNALTGSSQAHTNIQPYLAVNFCIALYGIFPSRN